MSRSADFQVLLNVYRQAVCDTRTALLENKDDYRDRLKHECELAQILMDRYLKLKNVLDGILAQHERTDWANCESAKYLQSCAYSEIITKIQAVLE